MSRNKENIPIGRRQDGPPHLSTKYLASDEFFTDSLLDVTRLSSRIPSPSPQKQPLTKARRARNLRSTRTTQPSGLKSFTSDTSGHRSRQKSLEPSTPQRSESGLGRLRTQSLSTPPGSNGEIPVPSPYSSISSPPPQDLTDTYRQIEEQDDLAQTEREVSSEDGNDSDVEPVQPFRPVQRSKSESPYKLSATFAPSSAASTPTKNFSSLNRHRRLNDRTETLSEASGLSFLKEITDQGLAQKLTPHISSIARDKARLREMWDQKPIAFSKASIPPRFDQWPGPSLHSSKPAAFSQALKPPPNGISQDRQRFEPTNRPMSQHSGTDSHHSSNGTRRSGEGAQILPTNSRIDRKFKFTNNFGFPTQRSALTEKNLEQQNRGGPGAEHLSPSLPSAPSLLSGQSEDNAKVLNIASPVTNERISQTPHFQRLGQPEPKTNIQDRSEIDWAAVAADIPIASAETSLDINNQDATPSSLSRIYSPEKIRRWDNDFTGQSFQVSESPPVRSRSEAKSQDHHWEIASVARQGVATNRLSEIRERKSQESLRNGFRSSVPSSTSKPRDTSSRSPVSVEDDSARIGKLIPDTPVVVYRSSINGENDKLAPIPGLIIPSADRGESHDHLQRLARAMSTTPRSSPASESRSRQVKETEAIPEPRTKNDELPQEKAEIPSESRSMAPVRSIVAQTPKVVGAWTDTILPETMKTVKQSNIPMSYAQTPHVSAGGWVETPAPIEQHKVSSNIVTIMEEVPEELTDGIVKDTASSDTIRMHALASSEIIPPVQSNLQIQEQPKSALASILDQQKNRLVSQDITTAAREDTLNLGNDTLESLQDLLALDENDLTTLSRLSVIEDDTKPMGEIQAESELIERLGIKLDRLRSNIHDARKGISKLEHQVSNPLETQLQITPQQLLLDSTCSQCHQHTFQPHFHPTTTSKLLPHASLNLSLPIPLLFYPRKSTEWFPRPTLLGSIVLAIWLWYITENTMCELYCRPVYTDFYIWPAEPEPEFPFVLPTMLARWTRLNNALSLTFLSPIVWLWTVLLSIIRALPRILSMALGWGDGFVAEPTTSAARVVKSVVETVVTTAASAATGIDLTMNDDEYL